MSTRPAKRRTAKGLASREALEGERFEGLLRTLAEILRDGRKGKELDGAGFAYLRAGVRAAVTNYGVLQFSKDDAAAQTLHKIRGPMHKVIEALRSEANETAIVVALGRHASGIDLDRGVDRRAALIADLETLAVVRSPPKGNRGNVDLYQLVHTLANDWVVHTGRSFTQDWENGVALSHGARFVHAVVAFVDRDNLASVPKMTEKVVRERLRGSLMPWLTLTSAK